MSSVTYLGQFFIILRHPLGFDCEMSSDEYMEAEFFPFRPLNAVTFSVNLHVVEVYFALALLPHHSTVAFVHVCHELPAHLHEVFLFIFLETQSDICKHLPFHTHPPTHAVTRGQPANLPQCSCGSWLRLLGGGLLESGWVCLKAFFRGFSCSAGDATCGRFQLYFGTVALTHQCGGVRGVGTAEASERQEGFPPRHFFHPMTRIPIMAFTASCPVATNTVWTAPRFTQSLGNCLHHRTHKKTRFLCQFGDIHLP